MPNTHETTPGILPTVEETQPRLATSVGAEVSTGNTSPAQSWYAEPREKRTRVRKAPQRKSPRLDKTQVSPIEANRMKQDDFGYEQHNTSKVYGLGVPKQQKVQIFESPTPSAAPQGTVRTNIPIFRNCRIITQEALNAVAFGVMEARPDWSVPTSMETDPKDIYFNVEIFLRTSHPPHHWKSNHKVHRISQR